MNSKVKEIENRIQELEDRIQELEKQRADDLRSRKWMSSCPERSHSYGKFPMMEQKVNQTYDALIAPLKETAVDLKRRLNELISPDSQNGLRSKKRKMAYKEREGSDSSSCDYASSAIDDESKSESIESSSSAYMSNESNIGSGEDESSVAEEDDSEDETGEDKKKKQNNSQDSVIEIDDSDSVSSFGSSDEHQANDSVAGEHSTGEDNCSITPENNVDGSVDADCNSTGGDESCARNNSSSVEHYGGDTEFGQGGLQRDHFDSNSSLSNNGDEDYNGEIKRYHVDKIKRSKLAMAAQGFRCQASGRSQSTSAETSNETSSASATSSTQNSDPFDPSTIEYEGVTFKKNHCYVLEGEQGNNITVGIRCFLPNDTAQCILIERFDDTLLGIEDEGLEYRADYMMGSHVQIFKCIETISLSKLIRESEDITIIPRLIYEPQTPGNWYSFGYFYDRTEMQRKGKRQSVRSLEVFAGCGGSLLGYHNSGFETVMAVEYDKDAVCTLRENNKGLKVYAGCIRKFIQDYEILKCAMGRIDHIHFSSPCQDFSSANRSQAMGPRHRADLSLLLVDLVRLTSCSTAVFENVVGIWRRKNIHYLKNITKELLKLGYQVRCTVLHSCDYGDPQRRPRFFMYISKGTVPMPQFPAKTHGCENDHLWPYVTVRDALSRVVDDDSLRNIEGRTTSLMPGQHGVIRLNGYDVAPTIRASAVTPFHYSHTRCINVREAACLQSFPLNYQFYGSLVSQYRQVGNAVPVELSTAVAQSIRQILLYEYEDVGEE